MNLYNSQTTQTSQIWNCYNSTHSIKLSITLPNGETHKSIYLIMPGP